MATKRTSPSVAGILGLVGIGVLPLLCCAGPALIAGGALGALGGVLGNPWLIGATAVLVIAAVGYALRRHRRQDCHTGLYRPKKLHNDRCSCDQRRCAGAVSQNPVPDRRERGHP
ncbi:hypothetical protein [Mycolicibacterium gadium]|uniref:hypothetical protein n=1 Tax=Mycolicibacterium gadium TaxID=1794 RepID=UPI0023E1AB6D|nr:hypothetical protein [Mycolicibacterium gadium]